MEKYIKVSDVLELIQECKWWFSSPAFRLSFEWKINDIDFIDIDEMKKWEFDKWFDQWSNQMQQWMQDEMDYRMSRI